MPAYGAGGNRDPAAADPFDAAARQRLAHAAPRLALAQSAPAVPNAAGPQASGSSTPANPPDTTIYNAGPNQPAGLAANAPVGMIVAEINFSPGVQSPTDAGSKSQASAQLTVHVRGLTSANAEQGVMLTLGGSAPIVTTQRTPEALGLAYTLHLGSRYDPDAAAPQSATGFWLTLTAPFGQRPLEFLTQPSRRLAQHHGSPPTGSWTSTGVSRPLPRDRSITATSMDS